MIQLYQPDSFLWGFLRLGYICIANICRISFETIWEVTIAQSHVGKLSGAWGNHTRIPFKRRLPTAPPLFPWYPPRSRPLFEVFFRSLILFGDEHRRRHSMYLWWLTLSLLSPSSSLSSPHSISFSFRLSPSLLSLSSPSLLLYHRQCRPLHCLPHWCLTSSVVCVVHRCVSSVSL